MGQSSNEKWGGCSGTGEAERQKEAKRKEKKKKEEEVGNFRLSKKSDWQKKNVYIKHKEHLKSDNRKYQKCIRFMFSVTVPCIYHRVLGPYKEKYKKCKKKIVRK